MLSLALKLQAERSGVRSDGDVFQNPGDLLMFTISREDGGGGKKAAD